MLQSTEIVQGFVLEINDLLGIGLGSIQLDNLLRNESLGGVQLLRDTSDVFLQEGSA